MAAQPVLPLLAAKARPDAGGWALVLLGVALLNLAVLAALRNGEDLPGSLGRCWPGSGTLARWSPPRPALWCRCCSVDWPAYRCWPECRCCWSR
ncbi:hypothetical protein GCM10027614_61690 [Micromonospora vulcania]